MLVPKLRFKREDGTDYPEWRGTSFGETCSGFEYGMNTAACDYDGANKYIRITDIDDTSRRYLSENAVSPKGNMQDKYIVNPNDILFARTGASVGKAYLYKDTDGLLYYAGFLIRANVNADANAYFVFSQTLTADYWNWVKLTSMRTGQQGINAQEYKGYKYNAPCLEEQQKIADFLSAVDEVIAQSEAEVQNLEQQKKAAMQKIFSQEVRFKREDGTDYPEWESVSFGSLIIEYRHRTSVENEDVLLSSAINGMFLNTELFGHQRGKSNIGYLKIDYGTLILSAQNLHLGNANVNLRFEHGIISPAYKTYHITNCNVLFMAQWIKREETNQFFYDATTVGASQCRRNVDWNALYEQKILLPHIEEQQKIAGFLSAYDEAIRYAKQELDKWKELKKGLLQQMFV